MSDSKGAAIDEWIDKYLPLAVPNYNMGILPDEEGYRPEFVDMRHHSEQTREVAKQAILAILAQEVNKARIDELKEAAFHIEGWDKYAIERYNYLRKAGLV